MRNEGLDYRKNIFKNLYISYNILGKTHTHILTLSLTGETLAVAEVRGLHSFVEHDVTNVTSEALAEVHCLHAHGKVHQLGDIHCEKKDGERKEKYRNEEM